MTYESLWVVTFTPKAELNKARLHSTRTCAETSCIIVQTDLQYFKSEAKAPFTRAIFPWQVYLSIFIARVDDQQVFLYNFLLTRSPCSYRRLANFPWLRSLCYENQFSIILKLELIIITKVSHLDSLWKRDWGELGNGLLSLLLTYFRGQRITRMT